MSGFTFQLKPNGKQHCRHAASRSSSAEIAATGGGAWLKRQDVIRRLRRRAGGSHDGAVVFPQNIEPRGDIVGMTHGRSNAERGAEIGGGNLGDQLLERILLRPKGTGQVAVKPCGMAARVTDFMECCPVPIDRFEIGLRRWDLHEFMPRVVECALAADPEIHTGRTDQRLGLRQHEACLDRRCDRHHLVGQPFALRRVEDGELLQEWDRLRFLAGLRGAPAFVIRREPVSIDDGRAVLALADMATEAERLAKGQPALAGKPVLDDGAPENEHVNPAIAPMGCGVPGHSERGFRRRRPPGLDPRRAACLQLGDDLVGDFLIEARPVVAGASASG